MLMIGNESRRVNVFRIDYIQKNEKFNNLKNGDMSGFQSRKNRLLGVDSLLDPDLTWKQDQWELAMYGLRVPTLQHNPHGQQRKLAVLFHFHVDGA